MGASRFAPTNVYVHPESRAGEAYRSRRASFAHDEALAAADRGTAAAKTEREPAIAAGFDPDPSKDLHDFGGRKIAHLTFTNFYVGGSSAWSDGDIANIDRALASAMSDAVLNAVIAQYYRAGAVTSEFRASQVLPDPAPDTVYKDTIEGFVAQLHDSGQLARVPFDSTVFNFMLPSGTVLVDGLSSGGSPDGSQQSSEVVNPATVSDEDADSTQGLGGYHGSIHSGGDTVYYAVGVYSEQTANGTNGIVAFDQPWKNVVATFYHELNEARTDADVEDAIRAGNTRDGAKLLGWMSLSDGEIGDIPMEEAGADLSKVMVEVALSNGSGTVPIQLMWSNAVHGPAGPA